jgi:hypothetical protein
MQLVARPRPSIVCFAACPQDLGDGRVGSAVERACSVRMDDNLP